MKLNPRIVAAVIPVSLTVTVAGADRFQREHKPNFILIMADDLGYGDVGFTGNDIVRTPYLDNLSKEGILFERFYAGAPVSSPTRASVLTGRNPFRIGIFNANVGILRPEEVTLPEILSENGYACGHFGKWHLGTLTCTEKDANRGRVTHPQLFNTPAMHGYREAFVTESKVPTCDPMVAPAENDGRFWDRMDNGAAKKTYGTSYWDIDGNKVTDNLTGDDSRIIMDRVIPFIGKASREDKPFLATVWFHAPHLPCVAMPEYADIYDGLDIEERNYYGCITAMDEQIGRLVNYLKLIGEYDNTVIFFCSDNGPERDTPGSASGFRDRKRSLHEGGIRVPAFCIAHEFKGTGQISHPCTTFDYLPTILDMAGIEFSPKNSLDGESILKSIQGKKKKRDTPIVSCYPGQCCIMTNEMKLYYGPKGYELYDLRKDPYEKSDLMLREPAKAEELKNRMLRKVDEIKASFDGVEYGTTTIEKLGQKWKPIF